MTVWVAVQVIVAAGDKGGKEATARLRKVVSEYSEQVDAEFKQRDADEARGTGQGEPLRHA